MSITTTLFILRLISGIGLLTLVGAFFYLLWRDYSQTVSQVHSGRRVYGRLVNLQEIEGSLVVVGNSYPLLPVTSIGRSPTNTVVVNDTFASSEHALVVLRNGQWWLEDRNSRNGTLLNENPVGEAIIMTHGDIIGIGSIRLRLELQG